MFWRLNIFGGDKPYVHLLDSFDESLSVIVFLVDIRAVVLPLFAYIIFHGY